MDWFLYDNGHRHERVKFSQNAFEVETLNPFQFSVVFHIKTKQLVSI